MAQDSMLGLSTQGKALYDYTARNINELSFKKREYNSCITN